MLIINDITFLSQNHEIPAYAISPQSSILNCQASILQVSGYPNPLLPGPNKKNFLEKILPSYISRLTYYTNLVYQLYPDTKKRRPHKPPSL